MKKIIVLLLLILFTFCSCGTNEKNSSDTTVTGIQNISTKENTTENNQNVEIEITESAYITMVNEIYNNMNNYLGKTLSIEGCFSTEAYNGNTYYYVYRTGPGCCGTDGAMCGFEFTFDKEMPKENDWIKVTGVLTSYDEEGKTYLSIKASSVDVLTQRGLATVVQ